MRLRGEDLERHPKRLLQEIDITSSEMARRVNVPKNRQVSQTSSRLQIAGSGVFFWTKAMQQRLPALLQNALRALAPIVGDALVFARVHEGRVCVAEESLLDHTPVF